MLLDSARKTLAADIVRWDSVYPGAYGPLRHFLRRREFRNVVYHRLSNQGGLLGKALAIGLGAVFPPERTLHIDTREIGPGLFVQHGFATIIAAERIGTNFWVNQQVTIGHNGSSAPIVGDDVKVYAGAIVIGNVSMGDGSRAAAGAIVTKDVPAGASVGSPAAVVLLSASRWSTH